MFGKKKTRSTRKSTVRKNNSKRASGRKKQTKTSSRKTLHGASGKRKTLALHRNGRRLTAGHLTVSIEKGHRKAHSVQKIYNNVLESNFTPSEQEILRNEKISINVTRDIPGGDGDTIVLGGYQGMHRGRHEILLDTSGVTEETITHELTHVLQEKKINRPEFERKMSVVALKNEANEERRDEKITLKEAMTEAETVTRCRVIDKNPGYYEMLTGDEHERGEEAKSKDRKLLYRGKSDNYNKDMCEKFDETMIKNLKLGKSTKTAAQIKNNMKNNR